MTHVNQDEIEKVKKLIDVLQMRQTLLSETTQVSDDALCPICYAQQIGEFILYSRCAKNIILLSLKFNENHHAILT